MLPAPNSSGDVLVVGAPPYDARPLVETLARLGYSASAAASGDEAVRRLGRDAFGAVFLHAGLPGPLDAAQVACYLRADPARASALLIGIQFSDTELPPPPRARPDGRLPASAGAAEVARALSAARVRRSLMRHTAAFTGGLAEAARKCRDELEAEHGRLRDAVANARRAEAARAAHNIGSIGAMTGLPALKESAVAANAALRSVDRPESAAALAALEKAVAEAARDLGHCAAAFSAPAA